jgi:hypothetical protein
MIPNEDAVDWQKVSRLEMHNVADDNIGNGNLHRLPRTHDFDVPVLAFLVQLDQLSFFLPIVDGADGNDKDNGYL